MGATAVSGVAKIAAAALLLPPAVTESSRAQRINSNLCLNIGLVFRLRESAPEVLRHPRRDFASGLLEIKNTRRVTHSWQLLFRFVKPERPIDLIKQQPLLKHIVCRAPHSRPKTDHDKKRSTPIPPYGTTSLSTRSILIHRPFFPGSLRLNPPLGFLLSIPAITLACASDQGRLRNQKSGPA